MKYPNTLRVFLVFICALVIQFNIYAQKEITDPIEYNDYIVQQQINIRNEIDVMNKIISDLTSTKSMAMDQIKVLIGVSKQSIDNLNNLKIMQPDFQFKATAINLLKFYKRIIETTYIELINEIYASTPDNNKLNELIELIIKEESDYDSAYLSSQKEFAAYYEFTLE